MIDLSLLRRNQINPALLGIPYADSNDQQAGVSYDDGSSDASNVSNVDANGAPISQARQPALQPIDVAARMKDLYNPSSTANDAYNSAVQAAPDRNNYQPSNMRKIGAMIAGMGAGGPAAESHGAMIGYRGNPAGAFNTASGIVDRPYDQAQEDYTSKIGALRNAAQVEEKGNNDKRILAEQTIGREVQSRNSDIASQKETAKEANDKANLLVRQQRAAAYDYKQRNPQAKIEENSQGQLVSIVNGKSTLITDNDGNAVKSSHLTDSDRINLQVTGRISEINASGNQARQTEETKETNREKLADKTIAGRVTVKGTPTAGQVNNGAKPPSATQEKVAVYNRAQKALADHPELKGYINLGTGNTVVISKPFMGDTDKMNQAHDLVYPPSSPTNNDEMVHVIGPNKESGMMKKSEVAQHKGWRIG